MHVFTHTDKGIFSLIPALLLRPGEVALDYVEGKRKRYFSIFQYLILIVGLTTFLVAKTGMMEAMMSSMSDADGSVRIKAVQAKITGFMQQYLNLVMFAMIPVYAFFNWLLFKKKGYNYAEQLVLQVAIQGMMNTYSLFIILPVAYFFGKTATISLAVMAFILMFTAFTIGNRQFFKVSWSQAFLKGLLMYVFSYIVQVILMAIIIFIIISTKSF